MISLAALVARYISRRNAMDSLNHKHLTLFGIMVQIFSAVLLVTLVYSSNANITINAIDVRSDVTTVDKTCGDEGLNSAAQQYGKYFGTATSTTDGELENPSYTQILNNWATFSQLTPSYGMKVSYLRR
jgi:hypothetical protein